MSIIRDEFAMGVSYHNKEYTPQQVSDYILQIEGVSYADPEELKALAAESQKKFQATVEEHNLTMDQILQNKTSEAGKTLAELTLQHCDAVIGLIVDGGIKRGIMI